jgi:general secretion pathway protein D
MGKIILTFIALGVAGLAISGTVQATTNTMSPEAVAPSNLSSDRQSPTDQKASLKNNSGGSNSILSTKSFLANQAAAASDFLPPEAAGTNADELRLNFRNVPLEMVLNYLSDAAGFIIVQDTRVSGNVSVISSHPVTRDEAVDLLDSVLNRNGYAAIRNGRTLTIVDKNDAKTRDIPVKSGNNPEDIPKNTEIVTQIIPIRFVEAGQLVSDLSSFVSPQATVAANEAGNSIVITDIQSNIRYLMEIIRAIDNSAEAETEIRVFHLKFANPSDVANELSSVFQSNTSSDNTTQSPINFNDVGAGPPDPFGGENADSSQNDRIKTATQVTVVADSRIQAVIVTAPKDLMSQIAGMINSLDVSSDRDEKVFVYHLNNGDPNQVAMVLQNLFQSSSTSGTGGTGSLQNSPLQQRALNSTTTTSSSSSTTGVGGGKGAGNTSGNNSSTPQL